VVPKPATDPDRMAKRLSLAHCHATVQSIQMTEQPAGPWVLEPAEEHRLFHRRSGSWAIAGEEIPASLILRAGSRFILGPSMPWPPYADPAPAITPVSPPIMGP